MLIIVEKFYRKQIDIIIERLCHELIENHFDFSNSVLVSLMPRGKACWSKDSSKIRKYNKKRIKYGGVR